MLLKKIFKPKWQHNNPEVRIEAISQLDWNNTEERQILESAIKNDADARVVSEALSKVSGVRDLLTFSKSANTQSSRIARDRLIRIIDEGTTDIKKFISNALPDDKEETLKTLATEFKDLPGFSSLLDALAQHEARYLTELAINHPLSQIRQSVAERITAPEALSEIASKTKSKDKGVYQKVKAKLQAIRQQEQEALAKKEALKSLCNSFEAHAETEVTKYYIEKLEALERQYADSNCVDEAELKTRIETALATCRKRAAELEQQIAADNKKQLESEQQANERLATIEELEKAISQLKQTALTDSAELAALDGLVSTQENRWLEATRNQQIAKSEQKKYQQNMGELRLCYSASKKFNQHRQEINELLENARTKIDSGANVDKELVKQLRRGINDIEWPEGFALPELLQQSADIVGEIQTIQTQYTEDLGKQRKKAEEKIRKLGSHISDGELKQALRLARDIHRELAHFPSRIKQELSGKLKIEQTRLDELKDWQGYATRPKQEDLCKRMEYLAEQHLEPHIKAQRIKDLQNEWRELGGSPDQKLWQRFKKASDQAFDPCKEFFGEEEKLKKANLNKREAICSQLDEFIEQVDWDSPDWKAVDKINRKAREEWRLYYPVDHKQAKPVQQRFNGLLAVLDENLNKEKSNNHRQKSQIITEAVALTELEDIREATSKAKALQKRWQSIGITDHKKDRELWAEFRKACDQIFDRLAMQNKEQQAEYEKAAARANELIDAVSHLCENIDESAESALVSLMEAFNEVQGLGDAYKNLHKKFQQNVSQVRKKLSERKQIVFRNYYSEFIAGAFRRENYQDNTPEASDISLSEEHQALINRPFQPRTNPASDILLRLEILAETETPANEKDRRMELQVERLTAGLNSGISEARSLTQQFEDLLSEWVNLCQSEDLTSTNQDRLKSVVVAISEKGDFS